LPLGITTHCSVESLMFNLPAHRLLKALLTHSPSPKTITKEFLCELGKCGNPLVEMLAKDMYSKVSTLAIDDWAAIVLQGLQEHTAGKSLLDSSGNCIRPKTPQDTIHPTLNHRCIKVIRELLAQAKRSQPALRDLVMLHDGNYHLLTELCFFPPTFVPACCTHIIPFSTHSKTLTFLVIETFSGLTLDAETIQNHLNHPCNTLNLKSNAHDIMDKHMGWGVKAISSDDQDWVFLMLSTTTQLKDGDEIHFGAGIGVSYACGASEVFDQFLDNEDNEGCQVPVYFSGPFVSDNVLMHKLETLQYLLCQCAQKA
ncbi:hypothetical protein EDD16DRAFT_1592059, partial [Pisolithus croceorrhizus]